MWTDHSQALLGILPEAVEEKLLLIVVDLSFDDLETDLGEFVRVGWGVGDEKGEDV